VWTQWARDTGLPYSRVRIPLLILRPCVVVSSGLGARREDRHRGRSLHTGHSGTVFQNLPYIRPTPGDTRASITVFRKVNPHTRTHAHIHTTHTHTCDEQAESGVEARVFICQRTNFSCTPPPPEPETPRPLRSARHDSRVTTHETRHTWPLPFTAAPRPTSHHTRAWWSCSSGRAAKL
jgi:hypothetical protein